MSNISDNLRYFPERPKAIKFWKRKYEFNLALSVIIKPQKSEYANKIKKRQKEIKEKVKNIKIINNPYKKGLYQYPIDDLHFTIINFLKYGSKNKDKVNEFEKLLKKHTNYNNIKERILKEIKEKIERKSEADLRWIYTGDKGEIDSISLQSFLKPEFIKKLKKIEEWAKNRTSELPCDSAGMKAWPKENPRAFIVNTLRFMGEPQKRLSNNNETQILDIVKELNIKDNQKPFIKNLIIKKIFLVESDPFLYEHKCENEIPLK